MRRQHSTLLWETFAIFARKSPRSTLWNAIHSLRKLGLQKRTFVSLWNRPRGLLRDFEQGFSSHRLNGAVLGRGVSALAPHVGRRVWRGWSVRTSQRREPEGTGVG